MAPSIAQPSQSAASGNPDSNAPMLLIHSPEKSAAASVSSASVESATQWDKCLDVIVAELNRQPFYLREIVTITKSFEQNLVLIRPGDTRRSAVQQIRKRYLDLLLTERLYTLAAAADPTVQPSPDEIEEAYQAEIRQFGGEENLERAKRMSKDDIRTRIALKLAIMRLRKKNVIDRINITSKLKEDYYREHLKDKFTIPAQSAVRGLFRFADSEVEMATEFQEIKRIRAEVEEALIGVEDRNQQLKIFTNFVRAKSEHEPTRFSGGYWYIYGGHHIAKEFWKFEDAAFEVPDHVLSDVVPLDQGYCLLYVDQKRPEYVKNYTEAESEIEMLLQKEQYESLQQKWRESLEKQFHLEVYEDQLTCDIPKSVSEETSALPPEKENKKD